MKGDENRCCVCPCWDAFGDGESGVLAGARAFGPAA